MKNKIEKKRSTLYALRQAGQMLVELILVMGLFALLIPALTEGFLSTRDGGAQQERRIAATAFLQEAKEAVRVVREAGWVNVQTNGTYHPVVSGASWALSANAETVAGLIRSIVIEDGYRTSTGSGSLVSQGDFIDPSTKKITFTVSWILPRPTTISNVTYLTRHDNISFTQTTEADFNAGTVTNTSVTNTQGGEVILGAGGGGGDWCSPTQSITTYDLPKSGVANAITAIEGRVFAGTGENASGVSFADVEFTTAANPPQIVSSKTFDGYKTNAVFGESNFAYLATDSNSKEVVMIDLNQFSNPPTNTKYAEVGSINLPGNGSGDSVYVVNDKAYILDGTKFYIYTLTSDRTSATLQNSGGYTLSGTGKKIIVGGGGQYAYIVTNASTDQFEILDISNATNPTRASRITVGSSQTGVDLSVTSSEAVVYVAIAYSAGKSNIYKIDTTNKSSPVIGLGYSTSGMSPKAIAVVTGNRLIVVGTEGTYQYQVLNTNTMAMCSATSGLAYNTGVNGISAVLQANGYAYSYIITGDASAELKLILGGAGGSYVSSGTFESSIYNPGYQTAFNGFSATVSQPSQTSVRMQVAVANQVSGSCTGSTYSYVGPEGDSDQYFTVGADPTHIIASIPLLTSGSYVNPGQCFRYKTWFTSSDSAASPDLYDVTVNYSP